MPRSPILPLLAALPSDPSETELGAIAERLAQLCAGRRQPAKALAVSERHIRNVLPPKTTGRLIALAQAAMAAWTQTPAPDAPLRPTGQGLIALNLAAERLCLRRDLLAERVKLVRFRRLYGWPFWDGHQWWFSFEAIDSATRTAHVAQLPVAEPVAFREMLPPWCERDESHEAGKPECSTGDEAVKPTQIP